MYVYWRSLVKEITGEYLTLLEQYLSYDADTGLLTWKRHVSYSSNKPGKVAGHRGLRGYVTVRLSGIINYAHRVAWYLHYGTWPEKYIDHINGVRDDNKIKNLREVSKRENNQNTVKHRNGKLVGTSFYKERKKWRAYMKTKGRQVFIGYFDTEQEAHEAYKKEVQNVK